MNCDQLCERDRDQVLLDGTNVCTWCELYRRESEARAWMSAYHRHVKSEGLEAAAVWWRRTFADIEHHRGVTGAQQLLRDIAAQKAHDQSINK